MIVVGLFLFLSCSINTFASNYTGDSTLLKNEELAIDADFVRAEMLAYARQYLGMRYRYGGTSPERGFDCSGLTNYVMGLFNVQIGRSSRDQANAGRSVALKDVKSGDIILFKRSRRRAISHVAMVVSNTQDGIRIIHSTSRGIVIDNLSKSKYWLPKVCAARDVLSGAIDRVVLPSFDPVYRPASTSEDVYDLSSWDGELDIEPEALDAVRQGVMALSF